MNSPTFPEFLQIRTAEEAAQLFMTRLEAVARQSGWIDTALKGMPMNELGEPCPWFTYPALHFLNSRDVSKLRVFEYGSGNSTLWWAKNAASVTSIEHDVEWHQRMALILPEHIDYVFSELIKGGAYSEQIRKQAANVDVVVIDGRDRVNCAKNCVGILNDDAVIIWDNADRARYDEGYDSLIADGYRRIDFRGFGPGSYNPWTTAFFYRDGNCLGI